jgi:hypothetical protein
MVFFTAPATSSRINQEFKGKKLLPTTEEVMDEIPGVLLLLYSYFKASIETCLTDCQRRTYGHNKKENIFHFRLMGLGSRPERKNIEQRRRGC